MSADNENILASALEGELRLPKLAHRVAGRLREQIVSGKLKPGTPLLPESQLLHLFQISRPTLREALRILEAEWLIDIGRGMRTGARVLGPSLHKAAEYTHVMLVSQGVTLRDLHEARLFLEPAILRSLHGLALARTTVRLRECLTYIQSALAAERFLDVVAGTNRFHEALVQACSNRAMALLIELLRSFSGDAYSVILWTDAATTPADAVTLNLTKTAASYSALCDLLDTKNTADAATYWTRYMERSMDFLKRSKIGEHRLEPKRPATRLPQLDKTRSADHLTRAAPYG